MTDYISTELEKKCLASLDIIKNDLEQILTALRDLGLFHQALGEISTLLKVLGQEQDHAESKLDLIQLLFVRTVLVSTDLVDRMQNFAALSLRCQFY